MFPMMFLISIFIISALSLSPNSTIAASATNVQFFFALIYSWLPAVNPVVGIWINGPYRKAFLQLICFFKPSNAAVVTVVQPIRQ
jgi:hypothetical protein